MNKDQKNNEQQKETQNQQSQKTEPIKLKQNNQQNYSKGNRTCMATGLNGIDFEILASIVQKEHSQIVNSALKELDI